MTRAVFLDRDGTVIELVHHLTDPAEVALIPGAGAAIATLKAAGWRPIMVTNQSVIGRGMLDTDGLARIHAEMNRQLAEFSAEIDAIYHCPTAPRQRDPLVIEDHMRKPGPGMLTTAARDHGVTLRQSWMVGDTISDMGAGRNAGCRTILVATGYGANVTGVSHLIDHRAPTLASAVEHILNEERSG